MSDRWLCFRLLTSFVFTYRTSPLHTTPSSPPPRTPQLESELPPSESQPISPRPSYFPTPTSMQQPSPPYLPNLSLPEPSLVESPFKTIVTATLLISDVEFSEIENSLQDFVQALGALLASFFDVAVTQVRIVSVVPASVSSTFIVTISSDAEKIRAVTDSLQEISRSASIASVLGAHKVTRRR